MFKDYNCNQLSFYRNTPSIQDDKAKTTNAAKDTYKEETTDDWTNTDRDTCDETTQVNIKDLMTKEINKKYNKKELEAFLTKAYDLVNEALLSRRDEIFIIKNNDDDTDDLTQNTLFKFSCLDGINSQENKSNKKSNNSNNVTPLKISDMTWSCKGSVLAISYYSENHVGPCSHTGYVAFFKFDSFNPDSKESCVYTKTYSSKTIVEINSCVKCIENHPTINNIFVAGTYKGELYYINIGNEKDLIECSSKVDSCLYREQVVSIKFVKMDDNLYYIVSISNEGRVLVWNPDHKLKYPVLGFNLKYPVKVPNNPINPSCFANNPYETFEFTVGTFDGSLYKCQFNKPNDDSGKDHDFVFMEKKGVIWRNAVRTLISNMKEKEVKDLKNYMESLCKDQNIVNLDLEQFFAFRPNVNNIYKNALKGKYEKHFSILTSVNYNYYIKNLVLTTSYDGSFRLYNCDGNGAKYFYSQFASNSADENIYFTCGCWSPFRPSLFAYGDNVGNVNFCLIKSKNTVRNILSFNNNGYSNGVKKICFNGNNGIFNRNIVSIIYEDGIVEMINLSESCQKVGNGEIENLNKILSSK